MFQFGGIYQIGRNNVTECNCEHSFSFADPTDLTLFIVAVAIFWAAVSYGIGIFVLIVVEAKMAKRKLRGGIHQMFLQVFYDFSTIFLRLFPARIFRLFRAKS
jgi:hypothetical protein